MQLSQLSKTLLAAVFCVVSSCGGEEPSARRPDVVVILCDTLRNDRLSCYGYPRETSPVIDRFASGGAVFEDVTAQWPWTLPSMVSMFQGQYITAYRTLIDPDVKSLPEIFKAAGYRTVGIVANCIVDETQGFARGMDQFDCLSCWDADGKEATSARDIVELRRVLLENLSQAVAVDENGERPPLFLYLHAYDPHDPYELHKEYAEVLPVHQALPVSPPDYWEVKLADLRPDMQDKELVNSHKNLTAARGRYDQEVRYFDAGLGNIIEDLKQHGVGDEAVFALVSDHGEGLWENLRNETRQKLQTFPPTQIFYQIHGGNGYQQVVETPFVMWGYGVPSGLRISAPVENVDLLPTLLEIANIAPPEGLDGHSLVPLMRGEAENWREYVYSYGSSAISVRHVKTGYKLIIPSGPSTANGRDFELYNLLKDPHERNDLAQAEPAIVKRLIEKFDEWMRANPCDATTSARGVDKQQEEDRKRLAEKLRSLGYTGLETGEGGE